MLWNVRRVIKRATKGGNFSHSLSQLLRQNKKRRSLHVYSAPETITAIRDVLVHWTRSKVNTVSHWSVRSSTIIRLTVSDSSVYSRPSQRREYNTGQARYFKIIIHEWFVQSHKKKVLNTVKHFLQFCTASESSNKYLKFSTIFIRFSISVHFITNHIHVDDCGRKRKNNFLKQHDCYSLFWSWKYNPFLVHLLIGHKSSQISNFSVQIVYINIHLQTSWCSDRLTTYIFAAYRHVPLNNKSWWPRILKWTSKLYAYLSMLTLATHF